MIKQQSSEDTSKAQRSATATAPAPQPSGTTTPAPAAPTKSYVDIYNEFAPYTPPTPEQIAKERKRRHSARIVSAVGDGLSALANLHFTTQYAPHVDQGGLQLSARNRQRWDQLHAHREARRKEWEAGYRRAIEMDKQQGLADRDFALRQEQSRQQQENWQQTQQENKARYAAEQDYRKSRDAVADARYQAEQEERRRQLAHERRARAMQLRLAENQDRREQERHEALMRGDGYSSSSSGRTGGTPSSSGRGRVYGKTIRFGQDGRTVHIPEDAYESTVEQAWQFLPEKTRKAYEDKYAKSRGAQWFTSPATGQGGGGGGLTYDEKFAAISALAHNDPRIQQKLLELTGAVPGGYAFGSGVRQAQLQQVKRMQDELRQASQPAANPPAEHQLPTNFASGLQW